ncbi:EAL domain-containing protein [Roseomonas sp. PWR1]|uniref:EAL domain-containing protein n=1 Tax=Roseomonas nitratireducens TaxID=2820810 RepID=A0ABS4AUA5_9PROT|nr:EAL domain-containing protein [Neoroseomonas nitratireducens]MBP0464887.1 EAL domain-containing protein [Neoroseomonas nitratireducens]
MPAESAAAPARLPFLKRFGTASRLLAGGLVLTATLLGLAAMTVSNTRENALHDAQRELGNIALTLGDHTERALEAIEVAINGVLERAAMEQALTGPQTFTGWAQAYATHVALGSRVALLPQVDALVLLNADGVVVGSSRFFPPPPNNLADRAYFQALRAGGPPVVIGPPVLNRGTNTWAFHIARRVEGVDGAFLGVALGVIELAYFERIYGALGLERGERVSLYRSDGVMLARHPRLEEEFGRNFAGTPRFPPLTDGAHLIVRRGAFENSEERLVGIHALGRYPLRMQISTPVSAVLESWRSLATRLWVGSLIAVGVLVLAVFAALRANRAEARAAATRVRLERERREAAELRLARARDLALGHAEFRAALEGMPQGVWKFDSENRLVIANTRAAPLLGMAPEPIVPGTPLGAIQVQDGDGLAATVVRRLRALAGSGAADSFVESEPDGRAISVAYRPLPQGGWLATFDDITERHESERHIRHMARHDPLTGLANRAYLMECLERALAELRADAEVSGGIGALALLYLDLDRFKQVNDTLGHPAGDALLRQVAARIRQGLRSGVDGRSQDMVARLGGDEFVVMLRIAPGMESDKREIAAMIGERLVEALTSPFDLDGQIAHIGTTIGIALWEEDGGSADELLRAADLALYHGKAGGRGRHVFFEPAMDHEARRRRTIETELRRALFEDEGRDLLVFFQPQVHALTRRPTGCEALVRWKRPGQDGLTSPGEFIDVAEETGLITALGLHVLRRACSEAVTWADPDMRVSVNLSSAQFAMPGLVQEVAEVLAATGLDPRRLELEVTESLLIENADDALDTMKRLRALGVGFALDDFGTGYSSLAYLQAFPFDRVKIDRGFVREIHIRQGDAAIVRSVSALCGELGMATIAEGIETEEQLATVVAAGCQEAQGFLFSGPVHPWRLADVLSRLSAPARPVGAPAGAAPPARAAGGAAD